MPWSVGEVLTATELTTFLPQTRTTWSSPINGGITAGNGTTVAHYAQIGPITFCWFRFTFGSTSAVTGDVSLDLPADAILARIEGTAHFDDASPATLYEGRVFATGTTTVGIRVNNVGSTYPTSTALSSTIPFTWTTSDVIMAQFWYFHV